jgi:hypothetical protein
MFRLVSIITLLFLFTTSIKADQNDPRLNNLFEKLNKTENQEQISDIIKDIWDIWYEVDDPKVIEYFEKSIPAMRIRNIHLQ